MFLSFDTVFEIKLILKSLLFTKVDQKPFGVQLVFCLTFLIS